MHELDKFHGLYNTSACIFVIPKKYGRSFSFCYRAREKSKIDLLFSFFFFNEKKINVKTKTTKRFLEYGRMQEEETERSRSSDFDVQCSMYFDNI